MRHPTRGEVWLADLNPATGHEQAGRRPVLILSEDLFNQGPAGLVIALPITSRLRSIPSHIRIRPPEGGLKVESAILCEGVRSISKDRLVEPWGVITPETLQEVERWVRVLLGV